MIDDMLAKAAPPPIDGHDHRCGGAACRLSVLRAGGCVDLRGRSERGHKYSRVVVIAPSHYVGFDFTSVYDGDAYATPLGKVPVDKEFARQAGEDELDHPAFRTRVTRLLARAPEHAIEVELPWLQKVLGDFKLVPIVMGDQSYESSRALGVALAKLIARRSRYAGAGQLRSVALSSLRRCGDDRPQDAACARGVGLLQHVAQLSIWTGRAGNLGGLRRRAHCGRNDLRRAHGREQGGGVEVRELRRHHRRQVARGGLQRRCVCEVRADGWRDDAVLADR